MSDATPSPPPAYATPAPRNGLGISALILGIVGAAFGAVPLTFWIAGILGVIGLILGLVGRARARRGEATNGKVALWGVVTSVVALVLGTIGMVIFFTALSDLGDDLDEISEDLDSYTECVDAIPADAPDFAAQMDACDEAGQ